jgi:hypothetical protein
MVPHLFDNSDADVQRKRLDRPRAAKARFKCGGVFFLDFGDERDGRCDDVARREGEGGGELVGNCADFIVENFAQLREGGEGGGSVFLGEEGLWR